MFMKEVEVVLPMADDTESDTPESPLERIRSFVTRTCLCPLSTKHIQMLNVDTTFAGKSRIEVGQPLDPRIAHFLGERVVAIFATETEDQFLVCTTHRGAWQDMPYVFGKREVTKIQEGSPTEKDPDNFTPSQGPGPQERVVLWDLKNKRKKAVAGDRVQSNKRVKRSMERDPG
jgi:hypothetical protein